MERIDTASKIGYKQISEICDQLKKQDPYILWLPSWYPNDAEPFLGDFIQRHAKAAALKNRIYVLFVTELGMQENHREEKLQHESLTEHIIYFKKRMGFRARFGKQSVWISQMLAAIETLFAEKGQPLLVHVHVPWKAGLVAYYLKKRYGIQYVLTEHWGIYNQTVEDNFYQLPLYKRFALRHVFRHAGFFLSVSRYLAEQVAAITPLKHVEIVPNVVDTSLFFYSAKKNARFTFIHASNMVPLKNVRGIIEAFHLLVTQLGILDVQLLLVGSGANEFVDRVKELGLLNHSIFFTGEVSYAEVAQQMNRAHCLIVNSTIENSPCVIGEALCSGLTVIATNVGGIPELVNSNQGILIPENNTGVLAEAMCKMIKEYSKYNNRDIAIEAVEKFSFSEVSRKFDEVYRSCFRKSNT